MNGRAAAPQFPSRFGIYILAAFLFLGCSSTGDVDAIRDRDWMLTSLASMSVPSDRPPTIRFQPDGRVAANTGCNTAGGDYRVDGNRLDIGTMAMTRRACADERRNELESAFVSAIERTESFRIAGDSLELLDASGGVLARFR
jgi:heat shock protein HslJ